MYLLRTVLLCISFLSTLHHDGMVHSNTTECTMLSSFNLTHASAEFGTLGLTI